MSLGLDAETEQSSQTNLLTVDKSDSDQAPSDDDSSDSEESVSGTLDVEDSPLGRLFSEIISEHPPSKTKLANLHDLLLKHSSGVKTRYTNRETALHIAARYGFVDAAEKLIEDGADVSAKDKIKRQPLHRACFEGHAELAEKLLDNGADIEARQKSQATPLDEACWQGHIDVVKKLLKRNANTQVTDKDGWSPLYTASRYGHREIVQCLLRENKSNINGLESDGGQTALHAAVQHEHAGVISTLIDDGGTDLEIDIKDKDGRTPLHLASIEGFSEGAKLLIAGGADCNVRTENSQSTPLRAASNWGHQEIVEALLDKGRADVDIQDRDDSTPLHAAIIGKHLNVVKLLLGAKAKVDLEDSDKQTPLHLASERGSENVVKLLLEAKAYMDSKDNNGRTALHLASEQGNKNVVKLLLEKKASVDPGDEEKQTPLHLASGAPDPDRSEPSDPTPNDNFGDESQSGQFIAVIEYLLRNGANPGARNKKGETAIHLAAAYGKPDRLQSLLDGWKEGDLLVPNNEGQTALYSAFKGEQPEATMKILLKSDMLKTVVFSGRVTKDEATKDEATKDEATNDEATNDEALIWAAANSENHDIAKWLLQKGSKRRGAIPVAGSERWGAIGWAAHEQHPRALSLLISKAPRTDDAKKELQLALQSTLKELAANPNERAACDELQQVLWLLITASQSTKPIEIAIDLALKSVQQLQNQPTSLLQPQKQPKSGISKAAYNERQGRDSNKKKGSSDFQTGHTASLSETSPKDVKGLQSKHLKAIEDILSQPPFGVVQIFSDSTEYQPPPQPEEDSKIGKVLPNFKATIVQFYKSKGVSATIQVQHPLQKVIYNPGPTELMQTSTKMQNDIASLSSSVSETGPAFTWIHLPSTNMDWMNALLTKIMKDTGCKTAKYNQLRSFFRDSWTEVPDRESPSRIMRPRTVFMKQGSGNGENCDKEGNTQEKRAKKSDKSRKPKEERDVEGRDNKPDSGKPRSKTTTPDASAIYMPYICFSTYYQGEHQTKKKYEDLLEAYTANGSKSSGAHESPTLDEWYYHFEFDRESTRDKDHRNGSQIVTKFHAKYKRDATEAQPNNWVLLRVNQLWVWTIDNKWLITATSCLLDDEPRTLVDEILEQLKKESEYGGSFSQPQSISDMRELLVEYCIGSYERKPKSNHRMSIAQTFSNYINEIGRDETTLLADFSHRTQDRLERTHAEGEEKVESSSLREETAENALLKSSSDDGIKKAIEKAEELYCNIKDVRDELNILKSAADHQKIVQKGLFGRSVKDADLTAAYVANELKELDIVAERIQSSINTTLSLQQSDLAAKQGKILMVFTFATLLFLPLSFLSSLFALDVASFLQTPDWAFLVLFLVSIAVSILVALVAIYSETISKLGKTSLKWTKRLWDHVKSPARIKSRRNPDEEQATWIKGDRSPGTPPTVDRQSPRDTVQSSRGRIPREHRRRGIQC